MSPVLTDPSLFVVVSGPPGSGKTSLASPLAIELGLPFISKDSIKEALLAELTVADSAASQKLGRASMAVLYRLAADSSTGAVIEANFRRSKSVGEIRRLPGTVVEVHCRCSRAVALDRYRARQRHAGHFDAARSDAELWDGDMVGPLAGGWPVFEVSTDLPVEVQAVVTAVRDLASVA